MFNASTATVLSHSHSQSHSHPPQIEGANFLNLLIVDDDRTIREACREVAQSLGFNTQVAESAEHAYRLLDSSSTDAVLLDLRLPGAGGLEALHAIKKHRADALVIEGMEAGGHTGKIAGLALVPQVVDAVDIPVIAAGSIVDGRGLAASLALGAQGVWMGTRFIAAPESHASQTYRDVIVGAGDEDTIITRCYTGKPLRVLKNDYVADWERRPQDIKPFPMQAMMSHQSGVLGDLSGAPENVDRERSAFAMGQGAGAIRQPMPSRKADATGTTCPTR